jgi:UDP-3-O-[3-hydroxymyristoyl] N-acetylglucosamine deacetylase/3-hydroxyacyl-[acyl-carrier-protein] dehydratase
MKKNQRTIKNPVELEGKGLFSGVPVRLRLRPAPADSGIAFVRTDLRNAPRIPVNPQSVTDKPRSVGLVSEEGVEVDTIEHLMSALGGLGIDNIEIDLSAQEVPNPDGCSDAFADLIESASIVDLSENREIVTVKEPISITEKDSSIIVLPSHSPLTISYSLSYPGTVLGQQHFSLELNDSSYRKEISRARTFCLESEAKQLLEQGLGGGGSTETAIVFGPNGPIDTELRWPDEPVRHKILDLLGDLSTLGSYLQAHVVAVRSGHSLNIQMVKKLSEVLGKEEGQKKKETLLDLREITKILPHRYPFLLIDKVIEMDGYRKAVGIKNVTFNEPFFQGHFPGEPIMPGVLQIEAMAQLAGVLLMRKAENQSKIAVLLSLDGVKLRKSVVPGDQLRIEVEAIKVKSRTGEVYARASVDGATAAEATMKFMIVEKQ